MTKPHHSVPLELSGALAKFPFEETTPEIGREYNDVNIINDLMNAENADDLRDLAVTSKSLRPSRTEKGSVEYR
jgi:hypothetical protein